jgi:hypothetical protein
VWNDRPSSSSLPPTPSERTTRTTPFTCRAACKERGGTKNRHAGPVKCIVMFWRGCPASRLVHTSMHGCRNPHIPPESNAMRRKQHRIIQARVRQIERRQQHHSWSRGATVNPIRASPGFSTNTAFAANTYHKMLWTSLDSGRHRLRAALYEALRAPLSAQLSADVANWRHGEFQKVIPVQNACQVPPMMSP